LNLLDSVEKFSPQSRVLFVSSSEVYGEPRPGTLPLKESSELRPISTYGVTKSTADLLAGKYAFRNNVNVIRVRPFPHLGPGQNSCFAISSFARQLAEIKLGKSEPVISVGNLEAKRDYSDVSDIVRGYREAVLNGKRGDVYNLCSGQSIEIGELLQRLIGVAEVEVEVKEDPARMRPVDITDMYGSHEKATRDFGWKPRIDLDGTLHSLFAFWVEQLGKK
jgi:GDP-4-dehydro-6-deoxy-D-mannose reductase